MPYTAGLLGTWKMISWKRELVATGEKNDVLGPDPIGYINYGTDGRFYALVVSRDRPAPATVPPSDYEKLKLYDSMLAYAGSYTVDDEKAVHHVDASWNQSWTGTDLVRYYKLNGDRLSISAAPSKDAHSGQEVIYRIEFCKL
jgi:Lipocalin-like domain